MKDILPKSPLGKALTYMRNHGIALRRYLYDARLPIDNNQSEQTIRPSVIGRRNWTFLGHPKAAAGRVKLFSIASSARRHRFVTDLILSSGSVGKPHFSNYHGFFSQYAWSLDDLSKYLLLLLVRAFAPTGRESSRPRECIVH